MSIIGNSCAIIVTYRPDLHKLDQILQRLVAQCGVVVCDNADSEEARAAICLLSQSRGASYISMGGNVGIARAQNVGIEFCWRSGYTNVLLLDDDSVPADNLVKVLEAALYRLRNPFSVVTARAMEGGRDVGTAKAKGAITPCRDLLSSGTLIPKEVFRRVGPFEEGLFIDGVDFEWGWRALSKGVEIYLVRDAVIQHRLGIRQVGANFLRLRLGAPVRHYYQCRNILKLLVRPYVPLSWKVGQVVRLSAKIVLVALLAPEKRDRLTFAAMGVLDAIRGRSGEVPYVSC